MPTDPPIVALSDCALHLARANNTPPAQQAVCSTAVNRHFTSSENAILNCECTCCQRKRPVLHLERRRRCLSCAAGRVQHRRRGQQQPRGPAQRRHSRGKQQPRDVLQVVRRRRVVIRLLALST